MGGMEPRGARDQRRVALAVALAAMVVVLGTAAVSRARLALREARRLHDSRYQRYDLGRLREAHQSHRPGADTVPTGPDGPGAAAARLCIVAPGQAFTDGVGVEGAASHQAVTAPVHFRIYAVDPHNHRVTTDKGPVRLSYSDPLLVGSGPSQVTLADGFGEFTVTYKTPGHPTVSARAGNAQGQSAAVPVVGVIHSPGQGTRARPTK